MHPSLRRLLLSPTPAGTGPSLRAAPFAASPDADGGSAIRLLTDDQQRLLARLSTRLELARRSIVFHADSPAEWIFLVGRGVVKSYRDLPSGKRRVVAFMYPADVMGLAERGRYVNTTQAVTPVTLYRINLNVLTDLLKSDAELQFRFLCKVTHELRKAQRQAIIVGRRRAAARVAMFLHMLENNPARPGAEGQVDVPMSRSDTANYLGLSLEAVSRACRLLESSGIVEFPDVHSARIIDKRRFEKLALSQ